MANLPSDILDLLNQQVTHERFNEARYRKFAADFDTMNLVGFSTFFRKQSEGEHTHANKIMDYIQDRGSFVLMAILDPIEDSLGPKEMCIAALEAERQTTEYLVTIWRTSTAMDPMTTEFMNWFLSEQVEEERVTDQLLNQFDYFTDLGLIDHYAGELLK